MLPAQRNKVDIAVSNIALRQEVSSKRTTRSLTRSSIQPTSHPQSLSEEEQKLFRLYGKLPNRKDILGNKLKERKYFDSGDYALSKAGKQSQQAVGTAIPNPETIPHASTVSSPPGATAPVGSPNGTFHVGSPTQTQQGHNGTSGSGLSNPISVPGSVGGGLGNRQPAVSSFPTATGTAGSPQGKESSSLGREEVKADDAMEE